MTNGPARCRPDNTNRDGPICKPRYKIKSFFLPTGHSPHRHPSAAAPLVTLVPSLPQPPDASILFSAPLSLALSHRAAGQPPRLPLAPRRWPAAVPPSRAAPGRLRRPLSSPPRPAATAAAPTQAVAAAGLACWRAQRHGTARRRPRRAVPGPGWRHGGTARHGTAEPPCPGVPCPGVPVPAVLGPCPCRAARLATYIRVVHRFRLLDERLHGPCKNHRRFPGPCLSS